MKKNVIGEFYWDAKPVVLVAGGPSLKGFDFGRLAGLEAWLVGVNESIFYLPRCDCGVSVDRIFIGQRLDRIKEKIAGGMEMIIATQIDHDINATVLTRRLGNKLSSKPKELLTCGTSGYAALNVAYLKHAKKILLLGYDYDHTGKHYHEDYEWRKVPKRADCWHFWAKFYDSTRAQLDAAKIEIFNASPKSTIVAFDRGTIDEGLAWIGRGLNDGGRNATSHRQHAGDMVPGIAASHA